MLDSNPREEAGRQQTGTRRNFPVLSPSIIEFGEGIIYGSRSKLRYVPHGSWAAVTWKWHGTQEEEVEANDVMCVCMSILSSFLSPRTGSECDSCRRRMYQGVQGGWTVKNNFWQPKKVYFTSCGSFVQSKVEGASSNYKKLTKALQSCSPWFRRRGAGASPSSASWGICNLRNLTPFVGVWPLLQVESRRPKDTIHVMTKMLSGRNYHHHPSCRRSGRDFPSTSWELSRKLPQTTNGKDNKSKL